MLSHVHFFAFLVFRVRSQPVHSSCRNFSCAAAGLHHFCCLHAVIADRWSSHNMEELWYLEYVLGVFLWVLTYYLTITIIIKCSSSFYLIIWYNYFSFWLIVLTIIKRFFSFYLSDLSRFCEWVLSEERQLNCGEFMRNRAPVTSGCIWIFSVCLTCWLWAGPCMYFVLSDVEKYFNIKVYRRECAHETKVCVCVCQLVVTVEKVEILSWSHACLWMWSFQMSIYE